MNNKNKKQGKTSERVISVALPVYISDVLAYSVPGDMPLPHVGSRVLVPLRGRMITGYVVSQSSNYSGKTFKIHEILDKDKPLFPPGLFNILKWASHYYRYPLGEVCKAAHPSMEEISEQTRIYVTELGLFKLSRPETSDTEFLPLLNMMSGGKGYKLQYLLGKKFKLSTINKALKAGYIGKKNVLTKKGSKGTSRSVLKVFSPDDPEVEKWLKKGSVRSAVYHDLCEMIMPAPVDSLRPVYPRISKIISDLEEKNLVETGEVALAESKVSWAFEYEDTQVSLTDEQSHAVEVISGNSGRFGVFLLHGVTGSGKTEVYMRLMQKTLDEGKTALVIVPEISLTPQLASRFKARFGEKISVLHSGLTNSERASEWKRLRDGKASVAVGARSAVFAPVENPGIIIVDEEHDPSFKQAEGFRYNARDLALMRGKEENATVVLGSATPSVESLRNAETGKYKKIVLTRRPTPKPLPETEIVDLRINMSKDLFAGITKQAIEENLRNKKQTVIFLNRRGFAGRVQCLSCGEPVMCPNCSVSLTFHRKQNLLRCHYCGYKTEVPGKCPSCGGKLSGIKEGTENVFETLTGMFPDAVITRMDRDSVKHGGMDRVINSMKTGKTDILLGTQMVTKGHDFPGVTLVVILDADQSMYFQDFRAAERTFQLLVQVSGRAGRGNEKGKVIIQTRNPFHYAVLSAVEQDTEAFYSREIQFRRELMYPPFGHLVLFEFESEDYDAVLKTAKEVANVLKKHIPPRTFVLGPAPAPLEYLRGKYRYHILIKSEKRSGIRYLIDSYERYNFGNKVKIHIDVDPLDML